MESEEKIIARGKPADYGQEIVKRRFRLTAQRLELGNKTVLDFGCGNGALALEVLQKPGGKPMPAAQFLSGFPIKVGDRFHTA